MSSTTLPLEYTNQDSFEMRIWGAAHRGIQSQEYKNILLTELRYISHVHVTKALNNSVDMRLSNKLGSRIEMALDFMLINYPDLYKTFIFTDVFRDENSRVGSSNSMHKYGGAFDFNYTDFTYNELIVVYEIFGRYGMCCPLSTYHGKDYGDHIEIASDYYQGTISSTADDTTEEEEEIYELNFITEEGDTTFDITSIYDPEWGKVGVIRNGLYQTVEIDYNITYDSLLEKYYVVFMSELLAEEIIRII